MRNETSIIRLEPKHFCSYLPYGVTFIHKLIPDKVKTAVGVIYDRSGGLYSIQYIDDFWLNQFNSLPPDCDDQLKQHIKSKINCWSGEIISNVRLHLLPISAITEPLEDGSVPIVELAKMAFGEIDVLDTTQKDGLYAVKFTDEEDDTTVFSYNTNVCSFQADYMNMEELERRITIVPRQLQLFEYLYSKHFDIHGLIHAGLAIDKRIIK